MGHLNDAIYFLFSEDTFIFQGKDYIGELRSVSIKRDNVGSSPDWYLETVNDWVMLKSPESTCCLNVILAHRALNSQETTNEVKLQSKRDWD